MHWAFICVEAILIGAPSISEAIPPFLGQAMFWTGIAGLALYPMWLYRERIRHYAGIGPDRMITIGVIGAICFMALAALGLLWAKGETVSASLAQSQQRQEAQPKKLTAVFHKAFKNEEVRVDGHEFVQCTFENVTLLYDGGPYIFKEAKFINPGTIQLKSSNRTIINTVEIMRALSGGKIKAKFLPK